MVGLLPAAYGKARCSGNEARRASQRQEQKSRRSACEELKTQNGATIQEGIDSLDKAIKLRDDYDDAMAYMNLMYRERADVECDDEAARAADLKTADQWVDKAMQAKQARAAKAAAAQGGQITVDQPK